MKKILLFSLLTSILMLTFSLDVDAQSRKKKKKKKKKEQDEYFDESGGFVHRLWYGGSFNLGFSGGNGNNAFNLGISPMVGYKITDSFSAGPRIGVDYYLIKGTDNQGNIRNANLLSYSAGVFSRLKFLNMLFVHAEYEYQNREFLVTTASGFFLTEPNGDLSTERDGVTKLHGGLGYNANNGAFGFELYALWNFLEPEDSFNLPISIRAGFTYQF